jgi:pimeloyl-ACP methyl ester carboxylesterase
METRVIDGIELAYRISGDAGAKPIVLIHGLTANMRDWMFTVKPLMEAGWRVLTADNPGHGDSSAPLEPATYEMAHVADVLHRLAMELGFAPAVIVGHSMGGAIAEEYAVRHGEHVDGLVLVASAGGSPRPYVRTPEMDVFADVEKDVALNQGMEAVWELHQERGMWASVKGLEPQARAFLKARFCKCSPQGYLYGDRQLHGRRNTVADLRRFTKKALVVCGEHEEALMKGTSADLAAAVPDARQVTIPKAGHNPQFENPAAFNAALLGFLNGL